MFRRLAVNTGSNVAVLCVSVVVAFILTPVLVSNLGIYDYGLWEMLAAVLGYAGMLELGLRPTVSRFTAKYNAERDRAALRRLFSTSLVFLSAIGFVVSCVFLLWAVLLPDVLAPANEPADRYAVLLLILAANVLAAFPGHVAESVLEGMQRYYLKNMVAIVKMVSVCSIILWFITPDNGLLLLAGVSAVGLWVRNLVYFLIVMWLDRDSFRFKVAAVSLPHLRELVVFGTKSFVQGVSYRIETMTDSLVIGIILGPAMVPFYSIPANLVQYLRNLCSAITHAFMPLFSSLDARHEVEQIRQIYLVASKLMVGLVLPLGAGAVLLGPAFLTIWIGPEIADHSQTIILLLVLFLSLPLLNPFSSRYLTAINRHGIFAIFSPVSALLNLGLTILLVQWMGVVGAAWASLIAVITVFPIYLVYTTRHLGITVIRYVRESIMPAFSPTLFMTLAVLYYRIEVELTSYMDLVLGVLIGGLIYLPLFVGLALTTSERSFLVGRVFGMRR
ncbi:oligosaccharide flippase family protein [Methylonatrum kenyense]|uniref:oligosaccharide flippase family protein n=1 Tax=Methylonatrum kenyense TaxID=455253 RepID=UPI0020BDE6EB|nr:oligosaccharide flippase family protein [Methylonatrum kenyense]